MNLRNAREGDPHAQLAVAAAYKIGAGCEPSEENATTWVERAARQGLADAQWYACVWCDETKRDEAIEWCEKAAEQGHLKAQMLLTVWHGECLADGTPREFAKARYWAVRASQQGMARARMILRLYAWNDWRTLAPGELDEARRRASEGCATAEWLLAMARETGQDRTQPVTDAHTWYERAAAKDEPRACAAVARRLWAKVPKHVDDDAPPNATPWFDPQDPNAHEALRWYERAAARDHVGAIAMTGSIRHTLAQTDEERAEARNQIAVAAARGNAAAQTELAGLLEHGVGIPPDEAGARHWYEQAAAQDEVEAHLWLATTHRQPGAAYNPHRALHHAVQAAHADEQEGHWIAAMLRLGATQHPDEDGVRDWNEAITHLKHCREANGNDGTVELTLAVLHDKGQNAVPRDTHEALAWAEAAAEKGHPEAAELVTRLRAEHRHGQASATHER